MTPYKITSATITTYSGKRVEMSVESEYLTDPVRKVKERMLDWFCKHTDQRDPFVRIEVKTKQLFNERR